MIAQSSDDKRRFLGVRKLVDSAAPEPKAALRWAARHLPPGDLAELDKMMSCAAPKMREARGAPEHEHLRRLFFSATQDQQVAIRYVVSKMGEGQVAELEALVGRNARYFQDPKGTK